MPCAEPRETHVDREELEHLTEAAKMLCEVARHFLRQGLPLTPRARAWLCKHLAMDFRRARWYGNHGERDAALEDFARLYPLLGDSSTTMRAFFCSQCAWTLRPWLPANAAVANECPRCRAPLMWVSGTEADLTEIFRYL